MSRYLIGVNITATLLVYLNHLPLFNILMECWSIGVSEKQNPIRSSVTLNRGHLDTLMHRVHERQTITPVLHHSLKLIQAELIISDLALRAGGPKDQVFKFQIRSRCSINLLRKTHDQTILFSAFHIPNSAFQSFPIPNSAFKTLRSASQ